MSPSAPVRSAIVRSRLLRGSLLLMLVLLVGLSGSTEVFALTI